MEQFFPNRTHENIKNHWHVLERRQNQLQMQIQLLAQLQAQLQLLARPYQPAQLQAQLQLLVQPQPPRGHLAHESLDRDDFEQFTDLEASTF
ncbi:MAG: hypothetical protein LBF72_03370 [Holosporales bacterium]|jgi:hypothetical protein|nr:hypothetical protein [Holosporales bacterium]